MEKRSSVELPGELEPPEPGSPCGRIIDAARLVFSECGFDGATTRAIAAAAGVNIAMIHYYFRSKEHLYRRVLATQIIEGIRSIMDGIVDHNDRAEQLVGFVMAFIDLLHSRPHWVGFIRREIADGGRRAKAVIDELGTGGLRRAFDHLKHLWESLAATGRVPDVPAHYAIQFLISSGYGLMLMEPVLNHLSAGDESVEADWEQRRAVFQRLLLRAISL